MHIVLSVLIEEIIDYRSLEKQTGTFTKITLYLLNHVATLKTHRCNLMDDNNVFALELSWDFTRSKNRFSKKRPARQWLGCASRNFAYLLRGPWLLKLALAAIVFTLFAYTYPNSPAWAEGMGGLNINMLRAGMGWGGGGGGLNINMLRAGIPIVKIWRSHELIISKW